MCQRYVLPEQVAAEREFLPATAWWKFSPKFNVAAEQYVPAIRLHEGQSEGVMLRWGLIPAWVEGQPTGSLRARVHTSRLEQSRGSRAPWLGGQRCILPMTGFYVWQLTADRYRQPFFARLTARAVFGVAAIWDRWVSEEDDVIESCAMVCLPPNELLTAITGPQLAMPAILRRRDYAVWLHGTPVAAKAALQPYQARWMQAHPVSPRVNSPAVDDPGLILASGRSNAAQPL
jgi:putative SOS response-associated peptidase YedK